MQATKFIPNWVKVAVAIALGLGTMIGWKRIVVTVGEKIGKTHLTYAQGACAEITAAATIAAADMYGLPVSTTHVLSSGIAGTMSANGSGLQLSTVRNIALAWVLTLPAAMVISGTLYWAFSDVLSSAAPNRAGAGIIPAPFRLKCAGKAPRGPFSEIGRTGAAPLSGTAHTGFHSGARRHSGITGSIF